GVDRRPPAPDRGADAAGWLVAPDAADGQYPSAPFLTLRSLASGKFDHPPAIIVPQRVTKGGDRGPQRQYRRGLQTANRLVTRFEPIIRNPRIQMVDVMETDISGKPL